MIHPLQPLTFFQRVLVTAGLTRGKGQDSRGLNQWNDPCIDFRNARMLPSRNEVLRKAGTRAGMTTLNPEALR